jgi:hypothetical protein
LRAVSIRVFPIFIPNTEQTIEGLPSLMSGLPVFSEAVPRRQDAAQDDSQGIIACENVFAALENVEVDERDRDCQDSASNVDEQRR